jgi:hypothetical protein
MNPRVPRIAKCRASTLIITIVGILTIATAASVVQSQRKIDNFMFIVEAWF